MLYPTHQKYGILFGILMIPLSIALGFLPTITWDMRAIDIIIVVLACFMGITGAMFGARFPDVDSETSIPARRHPLIRKVFVFFKVKHRGRYSHDYATIGATFLIAYFLVHRGGNTLIQGIATGNTAANYITIGLCAFLLFLVGGEIIGFVAWVADKLKLSHVRKMMEAKQLVFSIGFVGVTAILLFLSGLLSPIKLLQGKDITMSLTMAIMFVAVFKVYVLFAWAGAYSHLFADMTTKQGVHFFRIPLAPAQVILKVKKIPVIGALLVPTDFRTGSKWEDFNALCVTIACVPASMIALFALFGFNLSWLF